MACIVDDQDFIYEGIDWPPVDRVCGGLLVHVPKTDGSRYADFYQGLARFAVAERNKSSTKDVQLELVKIRNLNERIDDSVYWCFFRLDAMDKSSKVVATYRVVVSYLADKHRQLRMFKVEGHDLEEVKNASDERLVLKLEAYVKAMEKSYDEELRKVKENQAQLETELSLMRENHAQLQAEFAIMKADLGIMKFTEAAVCSKSYQTAYKKDADSSSPPGKKARCE